MFCFGFIVPLEIFPLTRWNQPYRWKAANFDLCSALGSECFVEYHTYMYRNTGHQWHLISWHRDTRDTHTYCRALSSGAVTTCFYDLGLSGLRFEHPTFRLRGQRPYPLRRRRGNIINLSTTTASVSFTYTILFWCELYYQFETNCNTFKPP